MWQELRAELLPAFVASNPGNRPWAAWSFDILPRNPRRAIDDDPDEPTTIKPPWGNPWESDGYETSYAYLRRRGLLEPGERERIAAKHAKAIGPALEFQRQQVHRIEPKYATNVGFRPAELADVLEIWGPELLNADELRAATEYRITSE